MQAQEAHNGAMPTTTTFANPNAQAAWDNRPLHVPEDAARAVKQEAMYLMNCIGVRYSEGVRQAVNHFPVMTSPLAAAILLDSNA